MHKSYTVYFARTWYVYTKVWLTRVPLPFWEQILTWGKSKFTFSHISITHFYLPKYLLNIYWVKLQFKKIAAVIARNSKYCDIFFLYYRMLYLYLIFCSSALPRYKEYHDRCTMAVHRCRRDEKNCWIKSLFLFSLHTKSIFVALSNYSWTPDVTWTVLPMSLLRCWEHCSCVAVNGGSESSRISSKIS